jgi:quinol monooxygenase YgiN
LLYRDTDEAVRFITVDRWQDEASWRSFLDQWGPTYHALDAKLDHLTIAQRLVIEGSQ